MELISKWLCWQQQIMFIKIKYYKNKNWWVICWRNWYLHEYFRMQKFNGKYIIIIFVSIQFGGTKLSWDSFKLKMKERVKSWWNDLQLWISHSWSRKITTWDDLTTVSLVTSAWLLYSKAVTPYFQINSIPISCF